jgi:restriction system protein
MSQLEAVIRGIHAGKTRDADTLFLKQNVIALGWAETEDLSHLKADRESFKAAVAAAYPDAKPGAMPTNGGSSTASPTR